ncbi:MAG: MFS transporter [Herpetosiphonaceae bacterium]|nr:MFS transporter [Herpetosiphonaceae bacterium]
MQKGLRSPLLPIFLIIFVGLMGFGIILPLLPLYAEVFRAKPATIGILAGSYSLAQFLVTPYFGALSDRYGRRPILIISQVGTVLSYLLLGVAGSLPVLFIARLLDGISGGNISTAQAYISDVTEEKDRAKAFGLIGAAFGLGFILGPAIGGLLSQGGHYGRAAFAAAALSLLSLLLTIFLLPESRTAELRKQVRQPRLIDMAGVKQAFGIEQLGLLLIVFFVFTFSQAGFQSIFSLFGERRFGWGPKQNGLLLAYVGVLAVLVQGGAIGPLVRRFGERRLVQSCLLLVGAGLAMTAFVTRWPLLLLTVLPLGIGASVLTPTLNSLISRESPQRDFGWIIGLSQSAAALARVAGPLVCGPALQYLGTPAPLLIGAGCVVLAWVYAMRLHEPALPASDPRFRKA